MLALRRHAAKVTQGASGLRSWGYPGGLHSASCSSHPEGHYGHSVPASSPTRTSPRVLTLLESGGTSLSVAYLN